MLGMSTKLVCSQPWPNRWEATLDWLVLGSALSKWFDNLALAGLPTKGGLPHRLDPDETFHQVRISSFNILNIFHGHKLAKIVLPEILHEVCQ